MRVFTVTVIFVMKWYMKWIIYEMRIWKQVKLWSSQLWAQFLQLRREAWKIQDFNGVWTLDLAIPVRRSNQLSYEATDVDSFLTGPLEPTNDQLPTSVAS